MNDLENYFKQNDKRLINKWLHYFDVYDRHFSKYRNKEIVIVEVGVSQGGSLQMWKSYFGDKARIYGVDIDERCKDFEEENVKIFIGSQSDRAFLQKIKGEIPPIDILIDDGGHTMVQQIVTFQELFDKIKEGGVYLAEDLHTSYWLNYGGGYKRRGTFIEYTKGLIDSLNAFHSTQNSLKVSEFTKTAQSIHYYDSMIVIEKARRSAPTSEMTGVRIFEHEPRKEDALSLTKEFCSKVINKILQILRLKGFSY